MPQDINHPIVKHAVELRDEIEKAKEQVYNFSKVLKESETDGKEDRGEQISNSIIAFRHLEDAKMRIGKVIQATEGKSCYDK